MKNSTVFILGACSAIAVLVLVSPWIAATWGGKQEGGGGLVPDADEAEIAHQGRAPDLEVPEERSREVGGRVLAEAVPESNFVRDLRWVEEMSLDEAVGQAIHPDFASIEDFEVKEALTEKAAKAKCAVRSDRWLRQQEAKLAQVDIPNELEAFDRERLEVIRREVEERARDAMAEFVTTLMVHWDTGGYVRYSAAEAEAAESAGVQLPGMTPPSGAAPLSFVTSAYLHGFVYTVSFDSRQHPELDRRLQVIADLKATAKRIAQGG